MDGRLAIFVVLLALTPAVTAACPPSIPDMLYVKNITFSSENVSLSCINNSVCRVLKDGRKECMMGCSYFNFSGNYSAIKVLINGVVMVNSNISFYSFEWNPGMVKFPLYDIEINLSEHGNMSLYDNSTMKLYLDDELAGEYVLAYQQGLYKGCPTTDQLDNYARMKAMEKVYIDLLAMAPFCLIVAGTTIAATVAVFYLKKRLGKK
jgi:hypothetical protein